MRRQLTPEINAISTILLAVTVVGLPFAKQHLKLMWVSLLPFGRHLA